MRLALIGLGVSALGVGLPATGMLSSDIGWVIVAVGLVVVLLALLPPRFLHRFERKETRPWIRASDRADVRIKGLKVRGHDGAEFGDDAKVRGEDWDVGPHSDPPKPPKQKDD